MQIMIPLAGRRMLLACILLILLIISGATFFLFRNGTRSEDSRFVHLDSLVRVLETYHERHGFYPQPAARTETIEGMRHVWGYREGKPALASCTIARNGEVIDSEASVCGGEVYDAEGQVIGWKGTIAMESGADSIGVARGNSRIIAPLGDILKVLPMDPSFAAFPDLPVQGFGEYIYAVRVPEEGAQAKGGTQYQLAATVKDPATGALRTVIRGNYFVRTEEREVLPPSLIGPGMLLDEKGDPQGDSPLHVLLDGQKKGFPNPLLGEGEEVLRKLSLQGKAEVLTRMLEKRSELLALLPESPARDSLEEALVVLGQEIKTLHAELTANPLDPSLPEDLARFEVRAEEIAQNLEQALSAFLSAKADEVEVALTEERDHRDAHIEALSGAMLSLLTVEKDILFTRDEILKYLDGEGIEEQARSRAGRKMENALAGIPALTLPHPFLTEEAEKTLHALGEEEGIARMPEARASSGSMQIPPRQIVSSSWVFPLTVSQELSVLLRELRGILRDVQEDLQNPSVPMEELDDAMRRLSRALRTEMERISGLLSALAPPDALPALIETFQAERPSGEAPALSQLASAMRLHGDFAPLLFFRENLADIVLLRQPGVPDLSSHTYPEEAEYQGIPYPLP